MEKTLTSKSGPDFDLLDLADDLRRLRPNFELSIPARDAARDQIRKAAKDKTAPSEEARVRFSKLLQLLPEGLRHSMIRDIIDDMTGQSDAAQISRIVESIGDELRLEQENDPDRIVRRIFAPIIRSPTVVTAAWMAKVVENRLDFFRDMPAETKEEFGWRLRTALQDKEKLPVEVANSLINTAGLLEINLSQPGEFEGGSSA
jgi:hypothetical protein